MNFGDERLPLRFWDKCVPEPNSGCWLWQGYTTAKGYGRFRASGRTWFAHRHAYTTAGGEIPQGLVLDHLCRTGCCVNPRHLEPVTPAENTRRGDHKGRGGHWQRARTHCPDNHPYDASNTYVLPGSGGRVCRTCWKKHRQRYKQRKKEQP